MLPKLRSIFQILLALAAGALFLLVSCQLPGSETPPEVAAPGVTKQPESVTPSIASRTPVGNTAADTLTQLPSPAVITITFWTIDRFSPSVDVILQQITRFEEQNPQVQISVIRKNSAGQAGALNYLRSAQKVAPSVLPDLVLLNLNDLAPAWRTRLVQPLDDQLDTSLIDDLLPAARRLGTIDENLAGVPIELDVQHTVYNTGKVITTPLRWSDVLSSVSRYQFPVGGQNNQLNDALLIQYLSTGAQLTDEEGRPVIDEQALLALLNYYRQLLERGIITDQILEANTPQELWDSYLAGLAAVTHVNTHEYLTDQRLLANTSAAPIPSPQGRVVNIGRGWVLALVTDDPIRQSEALRLIEVLMQSDINAQWARRSATIPTRQSAFDSLAGEDPYWAFLETYLQSTQPPPSFAGYDRLSRILLEAIQKVIRAESTPAQATESAVQELSQQIP